MRSGPASAAETERRREFDAVYRSEYRQLVGLAYVLTGDRQVAEDLVQETFAEAYRRWLVIRTYDNPGAWLRRVLANRATSRGRRLVSETRGLARLRARPVHAIDLPEASEEVWANVRRLPRRQAQVIALRYWDDLGIAQIAEILDCGEETVKTHLKRARATLAERLDP